MAGSGSKYGSISPVWIQNRTRNIGLIFLHLLLLWNLHQLQCLHKCVTEVCCGGRWWARARVPWWLWPRPAPPILKVIPRGHKWQQKTSMDSAGKWRPLLYEKTLCLSFLDNIGILLSLFGLIFFILKRDIITSYFYPTFLQETVNVCVSELWFCYLKHPLSFFTFQRDSEQTESSAIPQVQTLIIFRSRYPISTHQSS